MANEHLLDKANVLAKVYSKVDKSGGDGACWLWTGAKSKTNTPNYWHSICTVEMKQYTPYRLIYGLEVGEIPQGMVVMHTCDNALCCNPRHLKLGSVADNIRDCMAKGRFRGGTKVGQAPRGEESGQSKLSEAKVLEIRRIYDEEKAKAIAGGYRLSIQYQLAKRFKVTQACIDNVVKHKTWRHI